MPPMSHLHLQLQFPSSNMPGMRTTGAYPQAVLLAILSAIAVLINLPPLFWHVKNRNIAAALLVGWLVINNFFNFLNATIWPNDNTTHNFYDGVGLCDIEVKIMVARSTALPATTFCILKSLADVMNTNKLSLAKSKAQRVRAMALDLGFGLGLPAITMILHYIIQPWRYAIVGISGCQPGFYEHPLSIIFMVVPPILLTVADVYLSGTCPLDPNTSRHIPSHPIPVHLYPIQKKPPTNNLQPS